MSYVPQYSGMSAGVATQQFASSGSQFQSTSTGFSKSAGLVEGGDPSQAGVGLFFQQTEGQRDRVYVKTIVKGGSADREGTVQPGDVILFVDGMAVDKSELSVLRSLILGEVGTFVTLGFERDDDDGQCWTYEVSLMRGNVEYFAQLKSKNMMQEEAERLRRQLALSEEELARLRESLRMAEGQAGRDKEALDRLRGLLRSAEEQLRTVQATLNQEMIERRTIEARLSAENAQHEQEQIDLERLRNLLNQADEKLAAANQSLEVTRRQKNEQDARYREEQAKRLAAEAREKQLVQQMEDRMEQDRRYREEQEQQLLILEEERRNYERLLREEQNATDSEKRRREAVEIRTHKSEHTRSTITQDNDRLLHMLKEAEDARATIEQARQETEYKNQQIDVEMRQIEEQGIERQRYIDELKIKLEQERIKWEQLLRMEQEGRKEDNQKYKSREEQLLAEINQLNNSMRTFKDNAEDKRRKLETNVMRLEQESKSAAAALKAEESLAEALRERLGVLAEQLAKTEDELNQGRQEKSNAQQKVQQFETEKLKTLERERAMDAELTKVRDMEQEKIDAIEQMKRKLHDERIDRERLLHEEKAQTRESIASRQEAEHVLRRAQDEGQRMVDNERRRLEREQKFRKSHEEMVQRLAESLQSTQGQLQSALDKVTIPVREYEAYVAEDFIFPDTQPRVARDPDEVVVPASPPPAPAPAPAPVVTTTTLPSAMSPAPTMPMRVDPFPPVRYAGSYIPPPEPQPTSFFNQAPPQIVRVAGQYESMGGMRETSGAYISGPALGQSIGTATGAYISGRMSPAHGSHTSYLMQQSSSNVVSTSRMSRSYDAAGFTSFQGGYSGGAFA